MEIELNEAQINQLFISYDINQNGLIDYSEFIASCIDTKVKDLEKYLTQAFKEMDLNNDGFLNRDEVETFFTNNAFFFNTQSILQELTRLESTSPEGKISLDQFLAYMKNELFNSIKNSSMAESASTEDSKDKKDSEDKSKKSTDSKQLK